MIGGRQRVGIVQAARHDVQTVGTAGMAIGERRAAVAEKVRVTSAEEWYYAGQPRVMTKSETANCAYGSSGADDALRQDRQ